MVDVSVVIPTKNRREMVTAAVRSVLDQTPPPREILVVDDGSTDGTSQALEALGEPRVRVLPADRPGAAGARNTGVLEAKGDLVAFLDADDEWLPGKLAEQVGLFQCEDPPAFVFSDALIEPVGAGGPRTVFSRQPPSFSDIFRPLLLDNFIPTSTVIVRRELLGEGFLFNADFSPAEDYDLWLRLCLRGTSTFCPRPLAVYRRHPGQTGSDLSVMFPACVKVIEAALRENGLSVRDVPGLSDRLWRLHYVSAVECARKGDREGERKRLLAAAALRPFRARAALRLASGWFRERVIGGRAL